MRDVHWKILSVKMLLFVLRELYAVVFGRLTSGGVSGFPTMLCTRGWVMIEVCGC